MFIEDGLVVAAWMMLLASVILWQIRVSTLYEQYAVTSGQILPSSDFFDRDTALLRSSIAFSSLFYSCLWSIKLSFLLFFRKFGIEARRHLKIWWWCVLLVTLVTWIVCMTYFDHKCYLGSLEHYQSKLEHVQKETEANVAQKNIV